MGRVYVHLLLAGLVMLAAIGSAVPAFARVAGPKAECFAAAADSADAEQLVGLPEVWQCDGKRPQVNAEQTFLRWDLSGEAAPRHLFARLGDFKHVTLTVFDADGHWTSRSYDVSEMRLTSAGPYFLADLPAGDAAPETVVAAFSRLGHRATAQSAQLVEQDPSDTDTRRTHLLLLAALCGMMLMPLVFNAALSRILRERFLLWHTVLVTAFVGLVISRSGLINLLVPLDIMTLQTILIVTFGVALAAALMFARNFLEPEHLPEISRRYLPWAAALLIAVSIIHSLALEPLRRLGGDFHTLGLIPPMLLYVYTLGQALANGSRAARFQAIGWAPLIATFTIQAASQLLPPLQFADHLPLFYAGILFETAATAMGVADRFMVLRKQRDLARAEAKSLEFLADRDPLTALLNRRAIEARFGELRNDGFHALAVLDLDHFKQVNDSFGHGVGDEVLRATAAALAPDEDTLVVRLGGEEFVMLMRGEHCRQRAEMRRQAIPARIAADVTGLDRIVTASMGLIELPTAIGQGTFDSLFAHADRLLYEAKQGGRNRTVSESMRLFAAPVRTDRHGEEIGPLADFEPRTA